jgi:hypothetical protein
MLINLGILASSGSLVVVPDLSGLTKTAAATAITNAGLTPVDGGSVNTENANLQDIVSSQSPSAGVLVEPGSQVTYVWFNFVAAPPFFPFFPPFFPFFPPFFPFFQPVIYYCTTSYVDTVSIDIRCDALEPSTTDLSASQCDSFKTVCSTVSYPACPSIDSCGPTTPPFFPFFPFFPPFFPSFQATCNESTCPSVVSTTFPECRTISQECINNVCTQTGVFEGVC